MAIELDTNGYSSAFRAFVEFADTAKSDSTFAQIEKDTNAAGGAKPLAERKIVPKTMHDSIGNVGRLAASRNVNNDVRELFRKTIIEMFGGSLSNVPKSVLDAMKMADFGRGKPLTARRIRAVQQAIDTDGSLAALGNLDPEVRAVATGMGYAEGELLNLVRAAGLYAKANGVSELEAMKAVAKQGAPENRLMNYGGRFLESVENFKNGLRLLESFGKWFDETSAELQTIHPSTKTSHFRDGQSMTLLNASETVFKAPCKQSLERFVFEELAHNPSADLSGDDNNKLFGLENNQAMGVIGRGFQMGRAQTFAQIPPEKRTAFFKAINLLCPIWASDAEEANTPVAHRWAIKKEQLDIPIARILKNLDRIVALEAKGRLTPAKLVALCFPEIKKTGSNPVGDVIGLVQGWEEEINSNGEGKYSGKVAAAMNEAMKATGCSVEDAELVAKGGKQLENVPYYSSGTVSLEHLGDPKNAGESLAKDLVRTADYCDKDGKPFPIENPGFRFNFPNGDHLVANGTAGGKANVKPVLEKLEALCGPAHPAQTASLMLMTSQSGLGVLCGGLAGYGIDSSEHSPVDFTLSRNAETGDITVRYSSPEELPFAFEWTATIRTDGFVASTPLRFVGEEQRKSHVTDIVKAQQNGNRAEAFRKNEARAVPLIEEFVHAAGADKDVIALLKDRFVCEGLLFNAAGDLRTRDEIMRRAAELKENVAELREATKGDPAMFRLGLSRLVFLGGKPVPKGTLAALVKAVKSADIGKLAKLSASTAKTPAKLHAAIAQLYKTIELSIRESGLKATVKGFVGGDDMAGMRALTVGLLMGRFSEAQLHAMKTALQSREAVKNLQIAYLIIGDEDFLEDSISLTKDEKAVVGRTVLTVLDSTQWLREGVDDALGLERQTFGGYPKVYNDTPLPDGFDKILDDVVALTKTLHADQIENVGRPAQQAPAPGSAGMLQEGNVVINP